MTLKKKTIYKKDNFKFKYYYFKNGDELKIENNLQDGHKKKDNLNNE